MAVVEQRVALGAREELAAQVVQETLDENPDDENRDGIINRPHLYSEERLDVLGLANSNMEKWITKQAIASRHSGRDNNIEITFESLSEEERQFFDDASDFKT
jgi:hypothetical protein